MRSFRALKPAPFQGAASGKVQRGSRGNHNLNRQNTQCGRGQASPTSAFSTEAEMHELLKQSAAAYLAALHLRIAGDDRIERLRVQISQSRVQRLCEPGRIPAHEQADHVLCRRFHACQHIRANGRAARQRAKLPRPDDFTNRTGNHCLRRAHGHLSLGILSGIKQKAEQRLRAFFARRLPRL